MKREAFNHSKILRLARYLNIPAWGARGICESIWLVTEREAPRGDIGKLYNEDIALQIDWREDPERLISCLIHAGLVEQSEEFRLIVHDWSEHAPDGVHSRLAKAGTLFADGKRPKFSKLTQDERRQAESLYKGAEKRQRAQPGAGKRPAAPASAEKRNAVPHLTSPHQNLTSPGGKPPADDLSRAQAECQAALEAAVPATGIPADELLPRASRPKGGTAVISRIDTCDRIEWLDATRDRLIGLRLEAEERAPTERREQATSETLTFYERHGWPADLAATCAAYVRINRNAMPERQAMDKWLDIHSAPHSVRIEVIRRTLGLLAKEKRDGAERERPAEHAANRAPGLPAEAGGAAAAVHRAAVELPGGKADRGSGGSLEAAVPGRHD